MTIAGYMSFHLAPEPITTLITKFGGIPVWLEKAQWPVSRSLNQPMSFIGQIALDKDVFGDIEGKMAYLFISERRALRGPYTFEPDSGENAVIVQPGNNTIHTTRPLNEGPRIYSLEKSRNLLQFWRQKRIYREYGVSIAKRDDPVLLDWNEEEPEPIVPYEINDCKVGGSPVWIQDQAWPYPHCKRLLVQLVGSKFPFHLALGDAATLFAFLSSDGQSGKLIWQCY
jgi:hypothetical protein